MKPRVLIFLDHFFPAKFSGGIAQSIHNLVSYLNSEFDFYVVCSSKEFGSGETLAVRVGSWVEYCTGTLVFYQTTKNESISRYRRLIEEIDPQIVYMNGIFSLNYFVKPLLAISKSRSKQVLIAPRGMLQLGALRIKPLKKSIYLKLFKNFLPFKKYNWHATDKTEYSDISKFKGCSNNIYYAEVMPTLASYDSDVNKSFINSSEFNICTISLITAKKGIHRAIEIVKKIDSSRRIVYNIFGPVKDVQYWEKCKDLIPLPSKNLEINYRGAISPQEVPVILVKHQAFLLPTEGENFGHAIFEALCNGVPTVITTKTPFKNLHLKSAGLDTDLDEEMKSLLENWSNDTSLESCTQRSISSRSFAEFFFSESDFRQAYSKLFRLQK